MCVCFPILLVLMSKVLVSFVSLLILVHQVKLDKLSILPWQLAEIKVYYFCIFYFS